jgi:hypothetical protein
MENIESATRAQVASQQTGNRIFTVIPIRRGEDLYLAFSNYKGKTYVAIRIWYADENGVMKPSNKGVNIKVEHLPALAEGIAKALEAARADGLLPHEA